MDLREAIYTRRSVRAYDGRPLERKQLDALLEAAVQAPTGMNRQPWAFGVIQDPALLRSLDDRSKAYLLATVTDDSPLARYRERMADPDQHIFHGAPALVVIYGKPTGATTLFDCAMAAQNLMLTACAMGLGTCWIGLSHPFLDSAEAKAELGVPADYALIAPLVVGYPAAEPRPVTKAAPEVVYWR